MKFTGPVRFILKGDANLAMSYTSRSRLLLQQAKDRMGPDKAYWNRSLPDGTKITVSSLGGINQIWIETAISAPEPTRGNHAFYYVTEDSIIEKIAGTWTKLVSANDFSNRFPNPPLSGVNYWSNSRDGLTHDGGSLYSQGYKVAEFPTGTSTVYSYYIDENDYITICVGGNFPTLGGIGIYTFSKPFEMATNTGGNLYDPETDPDGWTVKISNIGPLISQSLTDFSVNTRGDKSIRNLDSKWRLIDADTVTVEDIEISEPFLPASQAYNSYSFIGTGDIFNSTFERNYSTTLTEVASTEEQDVAFFSRNEIIVPKKTLIAKQSRSARLWGNKDIDGFRIDFSSINTSYRRLLAEVGEGDPVVLLSYDLTNTSQQYSEELIEETNDFKYTELLDYTRISLYAENLELIRNVGSQYTGYYLRERPASSGHTFESGVISEYHFNDTLIIEIVRAADGEVIFSLEIDNVDMYYYLPFGAPGVSGPYSSTCTGAHWGEADQPPDNISVFPVDTVNVTDSCTSNYLVDSPDIVADYLISGWSVQRFVEIPNGDISFLLANVDASDYRGFVVKPQGNVEEILDITFNSLGTIRAL